MDHDRYSKLRAVVGIAGLALLLVLLLWAVFRAETRDPDAERRAEQERYRKFREALREVRSHDASSEPGRPRRTGDAARHRRDGETDRGR